MAGRRRKTGKPMLRQARAQRRQARLATELGAAATPAARAAAVIDYVRAALGPTPSDQVIEGLVVELVGAGDRLYLERRHAALDAEVAAAATPRDQFAVAARYLRAAIGPGPAGAGGERLIEHLVHRLAQAGDRIYQQRGGR